MTRLQAAIIELAAAMGNRPWVLVFDPLDMTAEDWGYATEHSPHPGYVRAGLLRMATVHLDARLLAGGKIGKPISRRGEGRPHEFEPDGEVCLRCGLSAASVRTTGQGCVE